MESFKYNKKDHLPIIHSVAQWYTFANQTSKFIHNAFNKIIFLTVVNAIQT